MLRNLALAAALGAALLAPAPLQAQAGHLSVPAKQMVRISFVQAPTDSAITRSKMIAYLPDGSSVNDWSIPEDQVLVLTDVALEPYRQDPAAGVEGGRFYLQQAGAGQVIGLDLEFSGAWSAKFSKAAKYSFTAGFPFTTKAAPYFVIEVPWTQTGENITAFGYLAPN